MTTSRRYRWYNPAWLVLFCLVQTYRGVMKLSPFPSRCRFYPTCSAYAIDVLMYSGATMSCIRIAARIGKCHPFHPGGVDKFEPSTRENS